jgi:ferric-dicitrate binding protein FerR (iron transport regulator)
MINTLIEDEEWLNASEENRQIARQIRYIQQASDNLRALRSIDTEAGLKAVLHRIRKRRVSVFGWWQRAAAVLCLLLLSETVFLLVRRNEEQQLAETIVNAPEGSISSVVLPDNSKVWLNAGSRIVYGKGYGIRHRRLQLTGEGFFDVHTNPDLPLEVETGSICVCATGTKFNVKAYPDENTVSTTLVEGIVKVSMESSPETFTLKPEQMAVFNKNDRHIKLTPNIKTAIHTMWKERRWTVENAGLDELAPALQRRYAMKFVFDREALKPYRFRGEIPNLSIDEMAKVLQLTMPVNYRMSGDTLFIAIDARRKAEYDKTLH